jgi:WD40 repeat protein
MVTRYLKIKRSEDHSVKTFYASTSLYGREGDIKNIYAGHTAGVTDIKVIKTSLSHILYSVSRDSTLRIWDTTVCYL